MPPRAAHGLRLLAALAHPLPSGRAQAPSPPAATATTLSAADQFADVEARLHAQYPAYVGFEVYEGTLFHNVDSLDCACASCGTCSASTRPS